MAKIDYNSWKQFSEGRQQNATQSPKLNFIALKNDGESVIVRFIEDGPSTYDIGTLHKLGRENNFRRVGCLRSSYDESMDKCPLCGNGEKMCREIYVKCIAYYEENGEIIAKPSLWERNASGRNDFVKVLDGYIEDYGDLKDYLFKITRNGVGLDTTYDVRPAPPKYTNDKYPMVDTSVFDGYSAFGGIVKNLNYEQMEKLASGVTLDQLYAKKEEKVEEVKDDLPIEPKYTNEQQETTKASIETTTFCPPRREYQQEERQRKPWEVPTQEERQEQPFGVGRRHY